MLAVRTTPRFCAIRLRASAGSSEPDPGGWNVGSITYSTTIGPPAVGRSMVRLPSSSPSGTATGRGRSFVDARNSFSAVGRRCRSRNLRVNVEPPAAAPSGIVARIRRRPSPESTIRTTNCTVASPSAGRRSTLAAEQFTSESTATESAPFLAVERIRQNADPRGPRRTDINPAPVVFSGTCTTYVWPRYRAPRSPRSRGACRTERSRRSPC